MLIVKQAIFNWLPLYGREAKETHLLMESEFLNNYYSKVGFRKKLEVSPSDKHGLRLQPDWTKGSTVLSVTLKRFFIPLFFVVHPDTYSA
jgi:hypothetical protein